MSALRNQGPRSADLAKLLARRERTSPERRAQLDALAQKSLFRPRAIVFTDSADFTVRTARDGILHFLMAFHRMVGALQKAIDRTGGELLKVEGDSLLVRYDDPTRACRSVQEMEVALRAANVGRPRDEQLRFSYGIGYGEILDLDHDVYGLEVNLASKLGEDLARPGEALLTPSAAAALEPDMLRQVVPYKIITFGTRGIPVQRLRLPRTAPRSGGTRGEDAQAPGRLRRKP